MALGVYENILGLHIPICNALDVVQELQNQDNLRGVEAGGIEVEPSCTSEIPEDLSSRTVVELHESVISSCTIWMSLGIADQHVKSISVGEGCDQSSDKWVSGHGGESIPFIAYVFHLFQSDDCRGQTQCPSFSLPKSCRKLAYCRICVGSSVRRLCIRCYSLTHRPNMQAIPWRRCLSVLSLRPQTMFGSWIASVPVPRVLISSKSCIRRFREEVARSLFRGLSAI